MNKLLKLVTLSFFLMTGCSNPTNSSSVNNTSSSSNTSSNSTGTSSSSNSSFSSLTTSNSQSSVNSTTTSTSNNSSSSVISSVIVENGDIEYDGYYKATKQSIYFKDVRKSYLFKNDLPSTGNQKVLVVPVKFSDSTMADTLFGGSDKVKEDIEKVFFGTREETGWQSVSSFYQQSSYGKLNISGKVSDWCTLDMTFAEANSMTLNPGIATQTVLIAREVGKWYSENYADAAEYDLDQNGFIDALWMVYDWPADHDYNIDWAHAYWDYTNTEEPDIDNPRPYTYAWASVDFMYEGKYTNENGESLVDAHTFIHETGHVLGLDDYYDYDNKHSYAGCLDMMDYNIGDHNAFSKYLLNWVDPYVVNGECEITIRPTNETGDFIIVKDEWNHSSTDEYLLIEFYTPTGLNEKDSINPYVENYPLMYQNPGIKIYHVDARLGYFRNYQFAYYTDEILGSPTNLAYSTRLAHSNSLSNNFSAEKNYLIHLLEKNGQTTLHDTRIPATDDILFHEGDIFDPINYESCFKKPEFFNDGEYINYSIEITSLTDKEATIKFTNL